MLLNIYSWIKNNIINSCANYCNDSYSKQIFAKILSKNTLMTTFYYHLPTTSQFFENLSNEKEKN